MSRLWYRDDLQGYDDKYTFVQLFPTYDVFVESMNDYMIFNQLSIEDRLQRNIFNIILKRYKNHFFRFSNPATNYNKLAGLLEELFTEIDVMTYINDNLETLAGTTSVNKNYKTNNTTDENLSGYLNSEVVNTVDNGTYVIDSLNGSVNRRSVINRRIDDMRKLFMNETNEVVTYDKAYGK